MGDLLYKKFVTEDFDKNGMLKKLTINPPEGFNFGFDVVDVLAESKPDKLAMLWCNEEGDEKRFTFADMKNLSNKAANLFRSQGIGRGDTVMLILKRHHEFWPCIVALHKIGAVVIPATHLLTEKDILYRIQSASIKGIVCTCDGEVADHVDRAVAHSDSVKTRISVRGKRDGWVSYEEAMEKSSPVLERPSGKDKTNNSDVMLIYFTSGTASQPKMVAHDFNYPLGHIMTARYWQNVDPEGLHLTVADTGWGKAVWGKLYGQWLCEAAVFTYDLEKFVASELLEKIEKYGITTFCAPPTIYRFFIKENLKSYNLSKLKYATIAGEALNPEVYEQFRAATGIKLMEAFGQTETTPTIINILGMQPKPGSMGKPSPAYDVDIFDADGKPTAPGVSGEIVIRIGEKKPVGLFIDYHLDEERTKAACHDGYFHSGDVAWKDEDGYFWYVGRADDLIKSSGYRISPFEIESVLMEHPAVLECAITGAPDPVRGQVVKATIVLARGYTASDALKKEIQTYVKNQTAPYKYPRVVEFVEELPKTISGKIRRVQIREEDNKQK